MMSRPAQAMTADRLRESNLPQRKLNQFLNALNRHRTLALATHLIPALATHQIPALAILQTLAQVTKPLSQATAAPTLVLMELHLEVERETLLVAIPPTLAKVQTRMIVAQTTLMEHPNSLKIVTQALLKTQTQMLELLVDRALIAAHQSRIVMMTKVRPALAVATLAQVQQEEVGTTRTRARLIKKKTRIRVPPAPVVAVLSLPRMSSCRSTT